MRQTDSDSVDREAAVWLAELPGADRENETVRMRLLRVGRQLDRMLAAIATRHGMTLGDWETLSVLRRSGRPYSVSPSGLARALEVTVGTISVRIDRLQRAGLVEAEASNPTDARVKPVRLTEKGHTVWHSATQERLAIEQSLLSRALKPAAVNRLNGLLRRLMIAMESELGPPPRRHDDGG
jgi:DNA-binding MarR family transcriptional regulator